MGRPLRGQGAKDIGFFGPDGKEMTNETWNEPHALCLGVMVSPDPKEPVEQDENPATLLMLLNAYWEPMEFRLPDPPSGSTWEGLVNTAHSGGSTSFRLSSGETAAARETVMARGDQNMGMGARGGIGGSEYAAQEEPGNILVFDLRPRSLALLRLRSLEKESGNGSLWAGDGNPLAHGD